MKKPQTQVLYIHGGMTFKNRQDYLKFLKTRTVRLGSFSKWSGSYLAKSLGHSFQVISPRMPLQDNSKYSDWKIWFERYLPFLKSDYILIGESLGGIFLAKYLSENKLKKKARAVFLVCPPFDNSLPGDDLVGGFKLKKDLSLLEKNCEYLHLLFSENDNVVPVVHAEKFRKRLLKAHIVIYKNKNGHFQVSKFPEIIKMIKSDVKR